MASTWTPFLLPRKHDGIPPLLVKYRFGPSDYKVWLTDLTYIWTEALDKRQILRRALSVDTSIDPREDSAQLRLFLGSIADALGQRPGTRATFDEYNDIRQLTLNTSTPLPHPLRPLEWSIVLMLAPQQEFASEFVLPLLSQQLTAKVEKTSLLQQLKEKDQVISKLIEKVQGDGGDLGKLFPGAVSSKSAAGHIAPGVVAKSVKGLREFDQDQWEIHLANNPGSHGDIFSLLPQIFDPDRKSTGEGPQVADFGVWWKRVGSKDLQREKSTPISVETEAGKENLVDDEFQRQSTPARPSLQTSRRERLAMDPELKISDSPGKKDLDEDGSTTDESDDDLQLSHSKALTLGKDDALANGPTTDTKVKQSEPMDMDNDDIIASASDTDKSPAETHPVQKSKQKLGKVGGKGKDSSLEAPVMPTSKPKLGKIGRKGKLGGIGSVSGQIESTTSDNQKFAVSPKQEAPQPNAAPQSTEPEMRGRMTEQIPEPSSPRETSQERADRKRAQLKRELENKSHAAVKKKRRF